MANYCGYCGKKLEEGQVCDCGKNNDLVDDVKITAEEDIITERKKKSIYEDKDNSKFQFDFHKVKEQVTRAFSIMWNIIVKVFKSPSTFIKGVTYEPNIKIASAFIGLYAIITSLLFTNIFSQAFGVTGGIISGFLGGNSYRNFSPYASYDFPFGEIFGRFLLILLLGVAVFYGVSYIIGNYVFKGKGKWDGLLTVMAISFVPTIVASLIGFILSFISIKLTLIIFIMGNMITYIIRIFGFKETFKVTNNTICYLMPIVMIINAFVTYEVTKLIM